MRKPVTAIDVDDVLLEGMPAIVADYNKRFGTHLTLSNMYAAKYDAEIWGGVDVTTANQRIDEYALSAAFIDREPVQETVHSLYKLAECYELHVLTGRNDLVTELTNAWLERYFPGLFTSVSFSNMFNTEKRRSKGEMCLELGASFLIDDHLTHTRNAAECGLRVVLFGDYPWNQADVLPSGITRCVDWPAVLEYFDGIN